MMGPGISRNRSASGRRVPSREHPEGRQMKLILVTGCPRTGTTLLARWLMESAVGTFCTRESGISHVANWCLSSIRFLSRVCEFKELFLQHIRQMTEGFYRSRSAASTTGLPRTSSRHSRPGCADLCRLRSARRSGIQGGDPPARGVPLGRSDHGRDSLPEAGWPLPALCGGGRTGRAVPRRRRPQPVRAAHKPGRPAVSRQLAGG